MLNNDREIRVNENIFDSEKVKSLNISWIAGQIEIQYHPENTIIIREELDAQLDETYNMETQITGDELIIRYRNKMYTDEHLSVFGIKYNKITKNYSKTLTVILPENIFLQNETIDTVSSNLTAQQINAQNITFNSVSGKFDVNMLNGENIKCDTVSGKLDVKMLNGENVKCDTVSGKIEIKGKIKKANFNSTSGSINLYLEENPEKISLNQISGSNQIYLPENCGFVACVSGISKNIITDFPVNKTHNRMLYGDGSAQISISSISGISHIYKAL